MAAYNKFNAFVAARANGGFNLGADSLKVMLSNTAPVATNAVKADIAEIAAGNGYTAGGSAVTGVSSSQTGGLYVLKGTGPTFTASVGNIGPLRYAVLYDATTNNLIGWWDYGSAVTLNGATGDTLQVLFDPTNGILQDQ